MIVGKAFVRLFAEIKLKKELTNKWLIPSGVSFPGHLASSEKSHWADLYRCLLGHVWGQSRREGQVLRLQRLHRRGPQEARTANGSVVVE